MPAISRLSVAAALALLAAACGGGGGGGGTSPPPPPPPPPPGAFRPTLFIETDPSGAANVRVQEQTYDAFAPGTPQQTFSNITVSPGILTGAQTTFVVNANLNREKYGLQVQGTGLLSVYNYRYVDFDGSGSIFGGAFKIERTASAQTYIQRVFADGFEAPDGTYNVSNTDFLGVEFTSGPIYVRDATARNFGDAGVDTKSTPVYLMNVTFTSANRMLRAWDGTEIVVVNSIINAPTGFSQAWLYDSSATIRYYNVLWCVNATDPAPGNPACTSTPTLVEGEVITPAQASARMLQLTSNPLPALTPFFATQIDRIVVEYSTNNGASWQVMNLPNTGSGGTPPVGDPRYRIPLNLNTANYVFRASFERNGARVGEYSLVIDEAGNTVP